MVVWGRLQSQQGAAAVVWWIVVSTCVLDFWFSSRVVSRATVVTFEPITSTLSLVIQRRGGKVGGPRRPQYTAAQLQEAVAAVLSSEMTANRAASVFGIPSSTVRSHIKRYREHHAGASREACGSARDVFAPAQSQPAAVLGMPSQVEQEVVGAALNAVQMGFTLNSDWLYAFIMDMAKEGLQDRDQLGPKTTPTRAWARQLVSGSPSLQSVLPSLRRRSVSLEQWFNMYERLLVSLGFLGASDVQTRVWVAEEVGFSHSADVDCPVVRRSVAEYASSREGYLSVLCCGSACGHLMPPLIVFSGKVMEGAIFQKGPTGALYGVSDSGWVDNGHLYEWFQDFVEELYMQNVASPVVLLISDRVDYLSLHLLQLAEKYNIHILAMPAQLSSPFMCGVLKQASASWAQSVHSHCAASNVPAADNVACAGMLFEVWQSLVTPYSLVTAFRSSGLLPFKPTIPSTDKGEKVRDRQPAATLMETEVVRSDSNLLQDCLVGQEQCWVELEDVCDEGIGSAIVSPDSDPVEANLSLSPGASTLLDPDSIVASLPGCAALSPVSEPLETEVLAPLRTDTMSSPNSLEANVSSPPDSLEALIEDLGIMETTVLSSGYSIAAVASTDPDAPSVTQCAVCWCVCVEGSKEAANWVGCDKCHKWFHFYCVGLPEMIDSSTAFHCPDCLK